MQGVTQIETYPNDFPDHPGGQQFRMLERAAGGGRMGDSSGFSNAPHADFPPSVPGFGHRSPPGGQQFRMLERAAWEDPARVAVQVARTHPLKRNFGWKPHGFPCAAQVSRTH